MLSDEMDGAFVQSRGPKSSLDLLHWNDTLPPNSVHPRVSATNDSSAFRKCSDERHMQETSVRSQVRRLQPAGGVSTISLGNQDLFQEDDGARRVGSDTKRREMTGSGHFEYENDFRSLQRIPAAGVPTPLPMPTMIFADDPCVKRPLSLAEVAKQRELSGSFFDVNGDNQSNRRNFSSAKSKEMEGSNIFGRPAPPTSNFDMLGLADLEDMSLRTSVKISNPAGGRSQVTFGCDGGPEFGSHKKYGHDQKIAELSGSRIFEGGNRTNKMPTSIENMPAAGERVVSAAKRREMVGNDIFSNVPCVEISRSERQPPGGRSDLKLI